MEFPICLRVCACLGPEDRRQVSAPGGHYSRPMYLWVWRLSRHSGWFRQYSAAIWVCRSRFGPSFGCKKNARSRARGRPRAPGPSEETRASVRRRRSVRGRPRPSDSYRSNRVPRGAGRCHWSRRRPRSRLRGRRRPAARRPEAGVRRRYRRPAERPPRRCRATPIGLHRPGRPVSRSLLRPGRRCRRHRCRRTGRRPRRDPPRGRSTGCSPKTGRRRRDARYWRLHPGSV